MRDRLIELLVGADDKVLSIPYVSEDGMVAIADYLLANGVIVPPCKVGDTVYCVRTVKVLESDDRSRASFMTVCREEKRVSPVIFELSMIDSIGKTVFLTKEEAEQALKCGK